MLKYIEEFRKIVAITGFRNTRIGNTREFLNIIHKEKLLNVDIQFFDSELVATWRHLYFATINALTAFRSDRNFSKSLAMETLLYVSSQRQIRRATELVGIKPTSTNIAALVIAEKPEAVELALSTISKHIDGQHDDKVLELSKDKISKIQETFKITQNELAAVIEKDNAKKALVDMVIERMALLATAH